MNRQDQYTFARAQLMALICLYAECNIWLADYCRKITDGIQESKITGFTFQAHELQALGIDASAMLSNLIAGDTADSIAKATVSFDYTNPDGVLLSAVPGTSIDSVSLERVRLKPDPQCLPYEVLINELKKVCRKFKICHTSVLFKYQNYLCEDPMRIVRILCNYPEDIKPFLKELSSWHNSCGAYLNYITPPEAVSEVNPGNFLADSPLSLEDVLKLLSPYHISQLEDHDPRLRIVVPRTEIAKILSVSTKTLYRWEQAGEAVNGQPWPKPRHHKGNNVMYYLPLYLRSIQELIIRPRG